jgi:hypothetical protein
VLAGLYVYTRIVAKRDQRKIAIAATAAAPANEQTVQDFDTAQVKTYMWGIGIVCLFFGKHRLFDVPFLSHKHCSHGVFPY